jgi:hypothetical protein
MDPPSHPFLAAADLSGDQDREIGAGESMNQGERASSQIREFKVSSKFSLSLDRGIGEGLG